MNSKYGLLNGLIKLSTPYFIGTTVNTRKHPIDFKVFVLHHKSLHWIYPQYLGELQTPYFPSCCLNAGPVMAPLIFLNLPWAVYYSLSLKTLFHTIHQCPLLALKSSLKSDVLHIDCWHYSAPLANDCNGMIITQHFSSVAARGLTYLLFLLHDLFYIFIYFAEFWDTCQKPYMKGLPVLKDNMIDRKRKKNCERRLRF